MARSEKIEAVAVLAEKVKRAQSVVLADFQGLTVADLSALRGKLRAENSELKVIKNRLGRRALSEASADNMDAVLKGNTIWAFAFQDASAPAKVMLAFAKDNQKLVIKGGLLESRALDVNGVKSLSAMPGRKQLLAQMAGGLKQPGTKMATVVQAGLLKVAHAFNALGKKLESAA